VLLTATTSWKDGVAVVYLNGDMFFGAESASLCILVKDLLKKSDKIVIDLGNLTHIDSGGVGALVSAQASARNAGCDIKLCNLGNHTKEVLQITKLATVFQIFDNTADAIRIFQKASR
jgi:anti-sigma B factor antagonist